MLLSYISDGTLPDFEQINNPTDVNNRAGASALFGMIKGLKNSKGELLWTPKDEFCLWYEIIARRKLILFKQLLKEYCIFLADYSHFTIKLNNSIVFLPCTYEYENKTYVRPKEFPLFELALIIHPENKEFIE